MDFGALPPEINSMRMYAGPGPGSILAAAAAWHELAAELTSAASSYQSVVSGLTSGSWTGPSAVSMAAAAAPYVTWLSSTAAQAEEAAGQATAAVGAYETAFAATVPPPVIAANRSLLATLVATNVLGQNTPAIAATEAHYDEMWAQDAAAMYGYASASAAATKLRPFTTPPQTTDPSGLADQAATAAQAAGTSAGTHAETVMSAGQLISATPQALQTLASPASGSSSSSTSPLSGMSSMSSLSALTMPARMATMPMSMLMRMFMMGGTNTAAKATASGVAATGAGAVRSIVSSGLASSTGTLGSISLTGLGGGGSAISAGMGHAASIGALSVPSTWAGAAPSINPASTALPGSVAPAVQASAQSGAPSWSVQMDTPPMMQVAHMAGRGPIGGATPRFELRPTVVPRSPAGG